MPPHEYAELLLRKAEQDEFTIEKLIDDPQSPDEIIGFHAQQAVEKLLKAVLAFHEIRYRKTHDLVELIDLLRENNVTFPDELEEIRWLSPFATEFRYDELPEEPESPFERSWAQACVDRTRKLAESIIRQEGRDKTS